MGGKEIAGSKIIQINEFDVYMIGGTDAYPTLLARDYDASKACLKINIRTRELIQMANMTEGRTSVGVCNIGNIIYVGGGIYQNFNSQTCE